MQEIRNILKQQETLASFDLVVTTFPEVDELQHLLQPLVTSVLGVALDLIGDYCPVGYQTAQALITSSDPCPKVEKRAILA